jgi:hypothetical protein
MPMTPTTLATLRRYIAEPDATTYTDQALNDLYDANDGDVNVTAAEVWMEKAAKAAVLVDTTEGASSRKNSQVYSQALQQATYFRDGSATATATTTRSVGTRAIVRP